MSVWARSWLLLLRAHPCGGWMPRQLEAFARIDDVPVFNPEDREVAVDVVADVEVTPIRREQDGLGQTSDLDLPHLRHAFAVDLQDVDGPVPIVKVRLLRSV